MWTKARTFLMVGIGVFLCGSCQQMTTNPTDLPQVDPDVEEYVVYNDLLESRYTNGDISQILFFDHTRVPNEGLLEQNLASFQQETPLGEDLVNSFKERNQQPHPLEPGLDFGLEYQLLTQEEIDEIHSQDEASDWKLFYESYPNTVGFIYLSRVGFNADFSKALLYLEQYHYDRPIQGGYYFLVKQDGRWVIESGYKWMT